MTRFAIGSAMGFMLGAGLMMMPVGKDLRRDAKHKVNTVKRMMKNM